MFMIIFKGEEIRYKLMAKKIQNSQIEKVNKITFNPEKQFFFGKFLFNNQMRKRGKSSNVDLQSILSKF